MCYSKALVFERFGLSTQQTTKVLFVLILSLLGFLTSQAQSPYEKLIRQIQSEEVNFPFPQNDTIIVVGTIDVGGTYPVLTYSIPVSNINQQHIQGFVESSADLGLRGPNHSIKVGEKYFNDTTLNIIAGNHLHMTIRFNVINWHDNIPTVTVTLGSQSKAIPKGSPNLDFVDFLETDPGIFCWFPGQKPTPPVNNPYITQFLRGHFFHISWDVAGMGILTMPVLPVKIVYAPVADFKLSNTASIADTKVLGYSSSMSFTSVNSTTLPVPTSLSTLDDFLNDMGTQGKILSLIPPTAAIGKTLTDVTGFLKDGLGSNTITKTVSNSVTDQVSFSADFRRKQIRLPLKQL